MRFWSAAAVIVALLGLTPVFAASKDKDKDKRGDVIWTHPTYASLGIQSIAFLPAASFDKSFKSEKTVESQLSLALKSSGYRWVSPPIAKDMVRSALGDSGLAAISRGILANGRIDSLSAQRLCRALRVTAVLSARVDLFEQVEVEWNQSGKPSTTVQVHAAVVDSGGRLAWSAAGSETAEGTYHDPNAATMGVDGSGLDTKPVTAQAGAPSFEEVSLRLFSRWASHFPPLASQPAAAPAGK